MRGDYKCVLVAGLLMMGLVRVLVLAVALRRLQDGIVAES